MISTETIKPKIQESNWQYSVGHCAQRKVHSRAAAIAKDREILNRNEKKILLCGFD